VPPATKSLFERITASKEQMLAAHLAESRERLSHSGNKGASAEDAFRLVLREYLPRRLDLAEGEVIDSYGERSAQCDIVIVNEDHPFTYHAGGPSLLMIEGVSAVAEVKSVLNGAELNKVIEQVKRLRKLRPRYAPFSEVVSTPSDFSRYFRSPPYFLFAYESALSVETICERLEETWQDGIQRVDESLDAVFVLGRGQVLNYGDGKGAFGVFGPNGERLSGYWYSDTGQALWTLLAWLSSVMPRMHRTDNFLADYLVSDAPHAEGGRESSPQTAD
jgi:hypothetical protein